MRIPRRRLAAAVAGYVAASIAAFAFSQPAAAQRYPNLYPEERRRVKDQTVVSLQRALFVSKCYGRLRQKREDDGIIGPLTMKAIDVFVDEYRVRNPSLKPISTLDDLFIKAAEIEVSTGPNEMKYCELSRFLSQYFDGSELAWTQKYAYLYPTGQVEIARMRGELFKNGCYAEIPDDFQTRTGFGPYSQRALHVFVDEYAQRYPERLGRSRTITTRAKKGGKGRTTRRVSANSPFLNSAEVQRALEQEAARDSLTFCGNSRFLPIYFADIAKNADSNTPAPANPNVCEMPRAANDWLKAQEDDGRSRSKSSTPLPPLSSTLDGMVGARRTLLEAIASQPPTNADALGTSAEYRRSHGRLLDGMDIVNRNKAQLAKLGAIAQNDVCRKCFLLSNYEWLVRSAEFGRIPVTDELGRQINGGTPVRPLVMDLTEVYFDALLKSHTKIQEWRTREERFLTLLRGPSNSSNDFDRQRDARKAADAAKSEAMRELHSAGTNVRPSGRQPLDRASEFSRQRAVSCIGDFSFTVENDP